MRDSGRTRAALLAAAGELFAERGFDRTTVRDIGDRAQVDPALIARYFGSKAALYVAALDAEAGSSVPPDLLDRNRVAQLLDRVERRGAGPVFQAAVQAHPEPAVQAAAAAVLQSRLVAPLRDRLAAEGRDRPQLRAELAVAAFAGMLLGRDAGAFAELSAASPDELVDLVLELLGT